MSKRPPTVTACLSLMLLSALTWLALGIMIAAGLHPAIPDSPAVKAGMASGSIAAAGTIAGLVVLLARRFGHAYYLSLAALSISSLAILFDDVGWADLLALIINLVPLFLLIRDRAWYLHRGPQTPWGS
jgi:hypothetical protein